MTRTAITLARARHADLPRLVEMNRAAYPELVEEGVVWSQPQLETHLRRFPEGQLVAPAAGTIVGAISTLLLPSSFDALAPHTWYEATGHGFFTTHDPSGTTLYLADVYVDPAFQGLGVGRSLYAGLRALCVGLRRANVVAGGRLWGYSDVAPAMSAHEYVASVVSRKRFDPVLVSQLRAGFTVRALLPGYLQDARSGDWATLLEWKNPTFTNTSSRAGSSAARVRPASAAAL